MKILYAFLGLALAFLLVDTIRGDEIPASPNLQVHLKIPEHLIGTNCGPCAPSAQEVEKHLEENTAFYQDNPWAVAENWGDFLQCPNYIRAHQAICETAGYKSHFSVLSYLHPLTPQ